MKNWIKSFKIARDTNTHTTLMTLSIVALSTTLVSRSFLAKRSKIFSSQGERRVTGANSSSRCREASILSWYPWSLKALDISFFNSGSRSPGISPLSSALTFQRRVAKQNVERKIKVTRVERFSSPKKVAKNATISFSYFFATQVW